MSSSGIGEKKIALIGLGVMGQSILNGMLASRLISPANITATTIPSMLEATKLANPQIEIVLDNAKAIQWADVIIFCLKPKILLDFIKDENLKADFQASGKLFLSIAAGVTLDQLGESIKAPASLVRVMPNIAASVQQSMNIVCPGTSCSNEDKALAMELLATSGLCRELPESLIDVATAVCGCSPAFFCTIIEGMSAGAIRMGLQPALAIELAAQTMAGTAAMILQSREHPAVLRDRVTTPAGVTIEGLAAMEEGNIRATLSKAIEQCTIKSATMNVKK